LAADQGIVEAQYNLGLLYNNGQGVPQNFAEAVRWWQLAADQGAEIAQLNLGIMYAKGLGVPQNVILAHQWFNLAAARSIDSEIRDTATKFRDLVASNMSSTQIAEAQRRAAEWKAKGRAPLSGVGAAYP
jgi:hypothetical protein